MIPLNPVDDSGPDLDRESVSDRARSSQVGETAQAASKTAPIGIAVFGIGYVGAVVAGTLAAKGHPVIAVDIAADKVAAINAGQSPVIEPGLEELIRSNVRAGRLQATGNAADALKTTTMSMICVGTPSLPDGAPDLSALIGMCEQLGGLLGAKLAAGIRQTVIVRSTVLPGTMDEIVRPLLERISGGLAGRDFGLGYMPEFLREGQALDDVSHPPTAVISGTDETTLSLLRDLHGGLNQPVECDFRTAETIKFASNAWHAVKICFANEIGAISRASSVDGRRVMEIICSDTKLNISPAYMRPGFAFGGSCLPKDLKALSYHGQKHQVGLPMLKSLLESNALHVGRALAMVERAGHRDVLLLGLTFKPDTDDLRDSPFVDLARRLIDASYRLVIFDSSVSFSRLTGRNRAFLESRVPNILTLFVPTLAEGLRRCTTVVVGHKHLAYSGLSSLLRPDHCVIDLASIDSDIGVSASYQGICW